MNALHESSTIQSTRDIYRGSGHHAYILTWADEEANNQEKFK